jgi:hypothetical protein
MPATSNSRMMMLSGAPKASSAARALGRAQREDPVGRAAQLERAGLLQELELEVDLAAQPLAERVRAHQRRAPHERRDRVARAVDVAERQAGGHQAAS